MWGQLGSMDLNEYSRLDAVNIAGLVRIGQVNAAELVALARSAYERTQFSSRPLVEFYDDAGVGSQQESGVFRGVPMTLKDLSATQSGRKCERGSRLFRGATATGSSALVDRFATAGLTTVGRTATSEFAIAATVETLLNGTVANPWDPGRTTSGSSGGAAAAVALGIVPIAHGTDSGGSLRMPASCCGVVGLKPSRGRISSAPAALGPGDLTVEFAITKSIRDTALLLDVLHGPALGDAYQVPPPDGSYAVAARRSPGPLRIALVTEHPWGRQVAPECVLATQGVAQTCIDLGHHVDETVFDLSAETWIEAMTDVWSASIAEEVSDYGDQLGLLEGLSRAWAERGRSIPASRVVRAVETFSVISRKIAMQLTDYDVVLSPTIPTLPPNLGIYDPARDVAAEWYFDSEIGNLEAFTSLYNITGQPAISLPLTTTESGLPIGIQIAAKHYREDLLLALAAQLERAMPWSGRLAPAHASTIEDLPST